MANICINLSRIIDVMLNLKIIITNHNKRKFIENFMVMKALEADQESNNSEREFVTKLWKVVNQNFCFELHSLLLKATQQ